MRWLLHTGHLDGLVRRVRPVKVNPQARHCAGSTRKRSLLCLSERAKCSRWPETSFSPIPTRAESSRAVSGPSLRTCLSADRTVACRSLSLCGRGFFANGCTSDHRGPNSWPSTGPPDAITVPVTLSIPLPFASRFRNCENAKSCRSAPDGGAALPFSSTAPAYHVSAMAKIRKCGGWLGDRAKRLWTAPEVMPPRFRNCESVGGRYVACDLRFSRAARQGGV
jgi:hypothetical protein